MRNDFGNRPYSVRFPYGSDGSSKKNLKAEKKRIVRELRKGGGMSQRGLGKAFRGGGLA
jgi:hypothetical protein